MADRTALGRRLEELAESGRRRALHPPAARVRARGDLRRRRKRAAAASGGALLALALVAGGVELSLSSTRVSPGPASARPTTAATAFVLPTPAPGQEYAMELGYVYGAVAVGADVRVTVRQLRELRGPEAGAYAREHGLPAPAPGEALVVATDVTHVLTLPGSTLVEAYGLAGGHASDLMLDRLVPRLGAGPRWTFRIDYDTRGRVASLREAGQRPDQAVTRS
jgi:hypothetical protein